jgi:peptidoglycan/xylan/chitin deacetylase (PgdA/CDA1 family)
MVPALKRASLALSNRLGVSNAIGKSVWRRDRLLVLCYHGVSLNDEHRWNPQLYVSASTLAARLASLRRTGCNVLPLGEAVQRLYSHDLPERAVSITFDDGYFDFMERAYPLLEDAGYPATVYLTTKRVEHNRPIVNLLLSYILWKRRHVVLDARGLPGVDGRWTLADPAQRAMICARFEAYAKGEQLSATGKDDWMAQVMERMGLSYDEMAATRMLTLMNPAEVARMSAEGVDFQLHTHMHRTPAEPHLFVTEIRENRNRIEALTGKRPTHFCYPSGVYRRSYLQLLRSEGVVSATTCERGIASADTDPLLMPRFIDTDPTTDAEFEAWLTGAADWLPRRTASGRVPDGVESPRTVDALS